MKNVLYFSYTDDLNDRFSGVSKKIKSQVNAIENLGYNVYLSGFFDGLYMVEDEIDSLDLKNINKINKKKVLFDFIFNKIKTLGINILYIRMFGATSSLISFLRKVKNLNVKLILEIPTYPYDNESKMLKSKMINIIDRIYRKKYKNLLDYIVTFSDDDYIFGVKCINISNAVEEEDICSEFYEKDSSVLNFISVSTLHYWHGVDRFVSSIIKYLESGDEKKEIMFYIVGPENEYINKILCNIKKNPNVIGRIKFLGYKNNTELKHIYRSMHIGVGSLARHRSGIYDINTLKNKEYCANGLPLIYSENDKDLDGKEFIFKVNPDESDINISSIINWYNCSKLDSKEISDYSKMFTWNIQLSKVFRVLEEYME